MPSVAPRHPNVNGPSPVTMNLNFKELSLRMACYLQLGVQLLKAEMIDIFFNKVKLNRRSRDYMRMLEFRKLNDCMYMKILHILILQQQWEPIKDLKKIN